MKRFYEDGLISYEQNDFIQAKKCFKEYLYFLSSHLDLLQNSFLEEAAAWVFKAFPELISEFPTIKEKLTITFIVPSKK